MLGGTRGMSGGSLGPSSSALENPGKGGLDRGWHCEAVLVSLNIRLRFLLICSFRRIRMGIGGGVRALSFARAVTRLRCLPAAFEGFEKLTC